MSEEHLLVEAFHRTRGNGELIPIDFPRGGYDNNLIDKTVLFKITNLTSEAIEWSIEIENQLNDYKGELVANRTDGRIKPTKSEEILLMVNGFLGFFDIIFTVGWFQFLFKVRTSDRTTVYNIRKGKNINKYLSSPFFRSLSIYKLFPYQGVSFEINDYTESYDPFQEDIICRYIKV